MFTSHTRKTEERKRFEEWINSMQIYIICSTSILKIHPASLLMIRVGESFSFCDLLSISSMSSMITLCTESIKGKYSIYQTFRPIIASPRDQGALHVCALGRHFDGEYRLSLRCGSGRRVRASSSTSQAARQNIEKLSWIPRVSMTLPTGKG